MLIGNFMMYDSIALLALNYALQVLDSIVLK